MTYTSGNSPESPVLNVRSASIQACSLSFVFVVTLTLCRPWTNSVSSTSPSGLKDSVKYWNDLSKRILTSPTVTTNVLIEGIFRSKLPNRFGLMERKYPYPHLERSNGGFKLSYSPSWKCSKTTARDCTSFKKFVLRTWTSSFSLVNAAAAT